MVVSINTGTYNHTLFVAKPVYYERYFSSFFQIDMSIDEVFYIIFKSIIFLKIIKCSLEGFDRIYIVMVALNISFCGKSKWILHIYLM